MYRGSTRCRSPAQSMRSAADRPDRPGRRKPVQYFEMMGHRALYADGWKAVTRHQAGARFDDDRWELYHVAVDRSECHDLAEAEPGAAGRAGRHAGGTRPRSRACCPSTIAPSSCSALGSPTRSAHPTDRHYTYRPPLRPCPPRWAAAHRRAQLGPGRHDRPAGRGAAACSSPPAPRTPGSACSCRTTAWFRLQLLRRAPGGRSDVEVPVGASVVGRAVPPQRHLGTATLSSTGRRRRRRDPLGHAHHLERRGRAWASTTAHR